MDYGITPKFNAMLKPSKLPSLNSLFWQLIRGQMWSRLSFYMLITTLIQAIIQPYLYTQFAVSFTTDVDWAVKCLIGFISLRVAIDWFNIITTREKNLFSIAVQDHVRDILMRVRLCSEFKNLVEHDKDFNKKYREVTWGVQGYVSQVMGSIFKLISVIGPLLVVVWIFPPSIIVFSVIIFALHKFYYKRKSHEKAESDKESRKKMNDISTQIWIKEGCADYRALNHQEDESIREIKEKYFEQEIICFGKGTEYQKISSVVNVFVAVSMIVIILLYVNLKIVNNWYFPYVTSYNQTEEVMPIILALMPLVSYLKNLNSKIAMFLQLFISYNTTKLKWDGFQDCAKKYAPRDDVEDINIREGICFSDMWLKRSKPGRPDFVFSTPGSFNINLGQIISFVGQKGSGKSTMTHIISGIINPIRGSVWIDGKKA